MSTSEVAVLQDSNGEMSRWMPVMQIAQAIARYNALLDFTKQIMKEGKDYGAVPGTDKPTLLKPGAEKLCSFFGLTPKFEIIEKREEWVAEEPFFYYFYRCRLYRGEHLIAEADGSCNTRESKYRYRWVTEDALPSQVGADGLHMLPKRGGRISEPKFAIERAETGGKYGKPMAHWQAFRDAIENGSASLVKKPKKDGGFMDAWEIDSTLYRVPNPDICDQVNTCQKMAQKRSLIAVTLIGCNASEYFTQDLEDMEAINVTFHESKPAPKEDIDPALAELLALVDNGKAKDALELIYARMHALGKPGEAAYEARTRQMKSKKQGQQIPFSAVKDCLRGLWADGLSLELARDADTSEAPHTDAAGDEVF